MRFRASTAWGSMSSEVGVCAAAGAAHQMPRHIAMIEADDGFMAKFLEPYLPQLRDQLAQLDPFDAAGAYLHLSRYPKHAALIGAALYFVKQFLDQV